MHSNRRTAWLHALSLYRVVWLYCYTWTSSAVAIHIHQGIVPFSSENSTSSTSLLSPRPTTVAAWICTLWGTPASVGFVHWWSHCRIVLYSGYGVSSGVLTQIPVWEHLCCSVDPLSSVPSPQLPVLDYVAHNDPIWLSRCCPHYGLLIKIDCDVFNTARYYVN